MFQKITYIILLLFYSCVNDSQNNLVDDLVQHPLSAVDNIDEVLMPKIQLDKLFFDFGEIKQGELITTEFRLKNIGKAPLLIRSVKGSCGCTVPDWPKEVVSVGEESVIKVTFNSSGKQGFQRQTVTMTTNAIPSVKVLTITGTVLVSKK